MFHTHCIQVLNIVSKCRFFFIFKHSQAPKRSWKNFHGVLESPGKALDFLVSKRVGTLFIDNSWGFLHFLSEGCISHYFTEVRKKSQAEFHLLDDRNVDSDNFRAMLFLFYYFDLL